MSSRGVARGRRVDGGLWAGRTLLASAGAVGDQRRANSRRADWLRQILLGAAGMLIALLFSALVRAAGPLPALGPGDEGFAQVLGPRGFEFPRDHGGHPEYRQEWWYFTGNLDSGAGKRVGFELTFFRFGLAPGEAGAGGATPGVGLDGAPGVRSDGGPVAKPDTGLGAKSAWRARQIYMAHFAVTDVGRQRFRFAEKVSRGGAIGVAGARNSPLRVWVDDWVLEDVEAGGSVGQGAADGGVAGRVGGEGAAVGGAGAGGAATGGSVGEGAAGARKFGHWKLHAAEPGYELTLDAEALLAPVLNGDHGFSVKSGAPGAASYYYSIPRVAVQGQLIRDGKALEVRGLAWMDREWGSGTLGEEQQGWDWFALQLRDGGSLMFYSLRGRDGRRDPHSAGTWVSASGEARPLGAEDVQIDVLDYWKNPRGERYPARWRVRVPAVGVDAEVRPVLADQELMTGSSRYWEGAVDVVAAGAGGARGAVGTVGQKGTGRTAGDASGATSLGRGYVELVGYGGQ